jgi:uncharacterized iron-regulated protein
LDSAEAPDDAFKPKGYNIRPIGPLAPPFGFIATHRYRVTSSSERCFGYLAASPPTAGTQIAALAMVRVNPMPKHMFFCSMLMLTFLASTAAAQVAEGGYTPHRVFNSNEGTFNDFEMMLADLAKADVVFVGEEHDDPATHRLELAILEGLARRRRSIIIAMEMFERDTQAAVDDYLAGRINESEFLRISRPWPNYATDYRPLVEFARMKGWHVIAANVPRKYASQVARGGTSVLDQLPQAERDLVAVQISAPRDDYFKRFEEAMGAHPIGTGGNTSDLEAREMMDRFYLAQCVKDDTMAESIARAYNGSMEPKPLIVHFNGAFHSDYRLGTVARVRTRLEQARVAVVSIVPQEQLDSIDAAEYRERGDYIVFALHQTQPDNKH